VKTYVVLFRGINVGGNNILPMKELTTILEENNYQDIKTYIQSGNVVLRSQKKPDTNIGSIIQSKFGFKPEVIALEESEFITAINNNPFSSKEGKTIHFYFCKRSPKANAEKLKMLRSESEEYYIEGKVFYLHAPYGIGRSKLVANIESCLGVPATGRNLNTINKLLSMVNNNAYKTLVRTFTTLRCAHAAELDR